MSAAAASEVQRPHPTADAVLEVDGLTTGYGRTVVVRDASLSVPAGGVTALLGPNGAGKTTLLRAVCGFLPVSRGRGAPLRRGRDQGGAPPAVRPRACATSRKGAASSAP